MDLARLSFPQPGISLRRCFDKSTKAQDGRHRGADFGRCRLDVAEQGFGIADPEAMIAVGIFNIFGAGDLRRQLATSLDWHLSIGSTMQHERRSTHHRKYRAGIDLTIQQQYRLESAGSG